MKEIWKDVYCYPYSENYEVSNMGRVRRKKRTVEYSNGKKVSHKQRILSGGSKAGKYRSISMSYNGLVIDKKVSHLVYFTFNDASDSCIKHNMVIDHIDSDPSNDKLSNLQLISQSENTRRSSRGKYNLPKHISMTGGKYNVQKSINNKVKSFGIFDSLSEAVCFRDDMIEKNWQA
jgi:hypothetical protein